MNIKLELLSNSIWDIVMQRLEDISIDADKIADTVATNALSEIQNVIQNDDISDFEAIEQIVCIFDKYKITTGARHDFG